MKKYMFVLIIGLLCFFSNYSLAANTQTKASSLLASTMESRSIYNLSIDQNRRHNYLNSHSKVRQTKLVVKKKKPQA